MTEELSVPTEGQIAESGGSLQNARETRHKQTIRARHFRKEGKKQVVGDPQPTPAFP